MSGHSNEENQRDKMYMAAMLKIAMEMKKQDGVGFTAIFDQVVSAMEIEPDEFRRYLSTHMTQLVKMVKTRDY